MGFSAFIDVAIGLILMYLVLSLMCTTANEIIATALKLRAVALSKTITQLIDDKDVREAFYNHGLIANAKTASRGGAGTTPASEVDPNADRGQETKGAGKPRDKEHPSYFDSRNFAMALLDSLDPSRTADNQKGFPSVAEIKETVAKMGDSDIRDVLLASLATAEGNLEKLRDSVAGWFDTSMDRLTGAYKRQTKTIAVIVGIAVAALLNADSLKVGKALWNDEAFRGQVAKSAEDAVKKLDTPAGTTSACKEPDPAKQIQCLAREWNDRQALLRPFPIGWSADDLPTLKEGPGWWSWLPEFYWPDWGFALWLVLKAFGILWTGLALSLGAPFWFDVLKKFVNVRGTGPNPDEKKAKAGAAT